VKLEKANTLFGVRSSAAIKNSSGDIIEFTVLEDRKDGTEQFLPKRNEDYVFPLNEMVDVAIALEENIPVLIWGPHGSGKSSIAEQICNRTNRPAMRIQHSVDTEASDIVGQWALEGNKTVFHYGPLARAMRDGLVYIADEYDFALPNVLAIYQAVLEGEALFIKNAPAELAVVKPHADFRFVATGNTNGSGDETGLYQGTQLQNAANYSRFGMTVHMKYVADEKNLLKKRFGEIPEVDLSQLMEFTKSVRNAYEDKTITNTISSRELISVTRLAILRGRDKLNFNYGLSRGFYNRMSSIDAAAIQKFAERVFSK
jgi:cobaltochelatase CobS